MPCLSKVRLRRQDTDILFSLPFSSYSRHFSSGRNRYSGKVCPSYSFMNLAPSCSNSIPFSVTLPFPEFISSLPILARSAFSISPGFHPICTALKCSPADALHTAHILHKCVVIYVICNIYHFHNTSRLSRFAHGFKNI